ncbi:2TM domain-containing protein [Patescibacteria group bacterium]|nr:2TM domain-containing protein [Patescibacteria group bacterium]
MDDQKKREWAERRARELKAFYSHLIAYVTVNVVLFIINFAIGGGWWFYWVTIFWGIALIFHAIDVLIKGKFLGKNWEEKKVKKLMEEEGNKTDENEE